MPRKFFFGDDSVISGAIFSAFNERSTNRDDRSKMQKILSKAIVAELTDSQRYCLTEYYLHQRKMKDIAQELGLNPSTVTRHISKAKEKLRKIAAYY